MSDSLSCASCNHKYLGMCTADMKENCNIDNHWVLWKGTSAVSSQDPGQEPLSIDEDLLDMFAASAMNGLVSAQVNIITGDDRKAWESIAHYSYNIALEMIKEKERIKNGN